MGAFLLPALVPGRKDGSEIFRDGVTPLDFNLLEFWQWYCSDLVSNALRGCLAEFLVAQALGIANGIRAEWDPYDLSTQEGLTIEVKSAAYLQTWGQKAISPIRFDIAPTRFWDPLTNVLDSELRRQAMIYVFALLAIRNKAMIEPMDVSQWEFYVVSTAILDAQFPVQRQISLATLRKICPVPCTFQDLRDTIATTAKSQRDS
jgi:hypothetical protein